MKALNIIILFLFLQNTYSQSTDPVLGVEVGNLAPNISLVNVNGETVDLVSLRGTVVLIDFWASWCGPCRRENPNVVQTYLKYKDSTFTVGKGFTVYSVSLDQDRTAWTYAIEKDNLQWPYHVTDLRGWYSPYVQLYKVMGIPMNFLIDQNGVIIAKNLRGYVLPNTLGALLKK